MRIGLIRHGRTDWNALGKIQGQTNISLNEEGRRQAEALAERLYREKDEQKWDAIVSSDLSRAAQTAEIIANRLEIPLLPAEARLRERNFGIVEGTTEEERLSRWGKDWRQADVGQETDGQLRTRALSFINELAERYPQQNILVVTHGSLLAQLLKGMCESLENKPIVNMAFSIMRQGDDGWEPLLHNCTLHLEE
ncbi:histidine phosphatase family protein [Paenibacillus sp. GCM10027626]|uniref:histidine phosphatase family protein n=1 Tax=Paenibacillus sp. GCM10027626 TaxID=3273411 RepID=UPI00362B1E81